MLGTFILWFGWYSFNSGSALLVVLNDTTSELAALAAVNSTLAAGSAALVALVLNAWLLDRYSPGDGFLDIQFAMNGCLGGLVTITAGCAIVEPWAGCVIGDLAAFAFVGGNRLIIKLRIDDAVDAIPVHLCCGMLGIICVGLFASPQRQLAAYGRVDHTGLFYSWGQGEFDAVLLGTQLLGLIMVICWVSVFMLPFFFWLDYMGLLRCDPLEELVGLDTHQNGCEINEHQPSDGVREGEDDVSIDHFAAYKRRRQAKNDEILRKRMMIRGASNRLFSSVGSSASAGDISEYNDLDDTTVNVGDRPTAIPESPSLSQTSRSK